MVQLDAVVKRYHEITALDNVTLNINQGEYFALLGPNGAGKTTIIRILLDFTRSTSGSARIGGIPSTSFSARNSIGYLPENIKVPSFLTGKKFLERQARLYNLNGRDAGLAVGRVLEIVGMQDRQKSQCASYSKGMLQRIGLAAALLNSPKLLILDEPTNGLDPLGIREFRIILENLKAQGTTLLLNSHILSEVEQLCNSAAIMNKGRILVKDSISELVKEGESLEDVFVKYVGTSGR
jgi:ABC-2 type transport system ATP-binding protein